jgi:hypothetical protein
MCSFEYFLRPSKFAFRLVKEYGEGQWAVISQQLNKASGKSDDQGRIGKQCREVGCFADHNLG